MRVARRLAPVLVVLLFTASTPAPTPSPEPVFEIHRTAEARHEHVSEVNPLFVLLIGSDIREGDPRTGRADGLQLLAVNTETGRGTLVGIPRDSYVPIPGRGRNRINAALHFGGPELQAATVGQLTGLTIHYWVTVEFSRFRALVDRLGGVAVDVPYPMADRFSGAFFEAGPRHMNGTDALAFARNRQDAPLGDFGRQENIGRLMLAGFVKFRAETERPLDLLRHIHAFRDVVVSNVPVSDLLELGRLARRIDPADIQQVVLPGSTGAAGRASVVFLAPEAQTIFDAIREDATL